MSGIVVFTGRDHGAIYDITTLKWLFVKVHGRILCDEVDRPQLRDH